MMVAWESVITISGRWLDGNPSPRTGNATKWLAKVAQDQFYPLKYFR